MMRLSILCCTKGEPYATPFLTAMETLADRCKAQLVLACDGEPAYRAVQNLKLNAVTLCLQGGGYLETFHDRALQYCIGEYVLRLDDDERMSPAGGYWLKNAGYRIADHWRFPRAHFWGDEKTYLLTPHLWPDHQTRLSVLAKAGGRTSMHCGSPHGGGYDAPVMIEHHKFLVKTQAQRQAIADGYDRVCLGFGTGNMLAFSVPEVAYAGQQVMAEEYTDGQVLDSLGRRRTITFPCCGV